MSAEKFDPKREDREKSEESQKVELVGFDRLREVVGGYISSIRNRLANSLANRKSVETRLEEPLSPDAQRGLAEVDSKYDRILGCVRRLYFMKEVQLIPAEIRDTLPFGIVEDSISNQADGYAYKEINIPEALEGVQQRFRDALNNVRNIILDSDLGEAERASRASAEHEKADVALMEITGIYKEQSGSNPEVHKFINENIGRNRIGQLLIEATKKKYSVRMPDVETGDVLSLHRSLEDIRNVPSVSKEQIQIIKDLKDASIDPNSPEYSTALFEGLNSLLVDKIIRPVVNYIVASTNANHSAHFRVKEMGLPITRARKVVEVYLHDLFRGSKLNEAQISIYEQRIGEVKEILDYYNVFMKSN